jgi:hypothetical protein
MYEGSVNIKQNPGLVILQRYFVLCSLSEMGMQYVVYGHGERE